MMKRYVSSLFILLNLFLAVVQAAEWEMQSRSIQFQTVWGTAKNDVFALGHHGVIFHYDGTNWKEMDTGTVSNLYGLWGSSGRDVFAVGVEGTILHYDGNTWTTMNSGTIYPLAGVWGSSSRNLFAVGDGGTLFHYDGQTWSAMNSGTGVSLKAIWGSSSNDVLVVGDQGTILHYNGKDWLTMSSGVSTPIYSIWGSSSRDVFAVTDGGVILHYDGSSWKTMDSGTALPLSKIWGSSSSDVFAVGGGGIILHYDGNHWTPMEAGANYYLNGVWGSSSRDVFVVGNGDTILHYDGSLWNTMKRGAYVYLNDIWGISSRDLFAIGNSNQVFHYDGNQWTTMNSGSPFYLKGIWGTSGKEVFAVGGRVGEGEIIQYDGNNWTGMDSGTTSNLNGIGGNSSSEVFTVGDNGTILRYDGSRWKPMTSGTSAKLTSIWSNSSREVFAVGDSGTILQYNGSRWATMNSGTAANLSRVWGNAGNDVFAVGDKGIILHYDGQTWTAMDSGGTEARLTGVWGNSNVDVFASNWDGLILHYDGNRWTEMTEIPALLNGLWISPEGDAFAVGDTILYCANCQLGNSAIKVDPKLHNFWNIALGEINSQTFTISNTGSDKLQLKPFALTNATEFSLSNNTCSNAPLAPAGTCQVDVNFQPQSVGTKITKLTLPSQTETLQIPIGGTGCSITFQQVFNPSPKLPNFGAVWVGNSMILNQTVNLTAIQGCGEELYIDKIEVVGEHAAEFSLREMTCDYSKAGIQSYSNCQFNIVFTPTSAGDKQAELTFKFLNHEDLPAPPITIQASGHTESILGVDPQFHDFWNIALGQTDSQIFTVSNSGNIDAQLQQLTLTDATTEFSLNNDTCSNKPLAPANTCQVTVNFQPQTEGLKPTKLNLPSTTETLQVPVSGTGCSTTFQQVFNSYPELPKFGAIWVGDSMILNQTVSFSSIQGCGEQLYIESIGVTGKHATEFGIQDTQCHNSNYYGRSYSYCQFKTVFTPTSIGEKQAELIFKLSRAELPGHVISLQAKGIDSSLAQLEITPTEHDFGTVIIGRGSTQPQSFTLKNTGEVSLKVNNITVIGQQSADFSLTAWGCTNLYIIPPSGQCNIGVWFSPTSLGQKQARLTITAEARPITKLTAEAVLIGVAEGLKECINNVTIESTQNGYWNMPTTWSTSQIPTETDVVRINSGHTITGQVFAKVKTFCVQAGSILESADEIGTPLEIQATDYLENQGVIRGKNGANQTKLVCSKWEIGTAGCAQPGASVLLKVGTYFDKAGKLGDWWWWGTGGPILNTGEIIAGKGGDGSQYGAPGGSAIVLGRNTTNTKHIQAGDGGNILGTELGEGGLGGLTQIWGKLGGPGHLYVQNGAKALAGKGGNCNPQSKQQTGGNGGNLWLVSLPDVHIEGGITEAGSGGQGCAVNGQDGFIQIEPNVISLAGAATQVSGGNIAIYGGNDWTLDLSNLTGTVVEATGDITLAVGKEGLIDFRNSTGKILKANGEVQIFANNILLDPKKTVLDYIEAKNVVLGPSRLLRNVSLTGPGKLFGKPGDTLPIQLILANNGPEDDNYLVTATDSTGQNLGQLSQTVPVKGLETVNVEINTVVPATNPIILTATSQADPKTKATTEVFVDLAPVTTDNSIPNPNEPGSTQPDGSIKPSEPGTGTVINPNEPSSGETSSNPNPEPPVVNPDAMVVVTPSLNTCPSTFGAIIDWMCLNHGQILTDATLESNAKVSGGQLTGTIDNQGFISQVTIQPDTILTGGKLSGYIVNQGTLRDFEFVGAQVIGGTLAGQVINNSLIGGVFKEVHLAANTHLIGGYLQGEIQGDPAAPALLEDLTIQSGSHLAYVKIGKNVTWSADVVFEDNVQFIEPTTYCNPTRLADIVPLLPSLDTMVLGKSIEVCSQFGGGIATDGKRFQQQLTVTLAEPVEVLGRIAPDLRHVSQVVDWVLFAAYRSVETEPPLYFMIDTRGQVLPWNGDVSDLVAFKEPVTLESVQSIRLYRGKFPAKGQLEIQFGYRLADGTVVLNESPLEVMVLE